MVCNDLVRTQLTVKAHNTGRLKGFTLVELMIVIVIVGILAAIAYPSYQEQVRKSRRADAQNALMAAANAMEKYYWSNTTYTTDLTNLGYSASPAASPEGYYSISAAAGSTGSIASSYTLTATPVAGGPQAGDASCTTLTLNSRGVKGSTPGSGNCWGS